MAIPLAVMIVHVGAVGRDASVFLVLRVILNLSGFLMDACVGWISGSIADTVVILRWLVSTQMLHVALLGEF